MSEKVVPVQWMGKLTHKQCGSPECLTRYNPVILGPDILIPSKHFLWWRITLLSMKAEESLGQNNHAFCSLAEE